MQKKSISQVIRQTRIIKVIHQDIHQGKSIFKRKVSAKKEQ